MKNSEERQAWPLRFDSYSFGARCYNTLQSSILYSNHQLALPKELDGPSGQPHSPDWKDDWSAGFNLDRDFLKHGFPDPLKIKWTALDGSELLAFVDLDAIFPDRIILHNVPREEVLEEWALYDAHPASILLEVNDRTINVYMRARVMTKNRPFPDRPDIRSRRDLVLACTNTY